MSSWDLTWKLSQTKYHKKTFLRQPGRVGKAWRTPRNYLPKKCVGCASGYARKYSCLFHKMYAEIRKGVMTCSMGSVLKYWRKKQKRNRNRWRKHGKILKTIESEIWEGPFRSPEKQEGTAWEGNWEKAGGGGREPSDWGVEKEKEGGLGRKSP